jgi:KaiC/GvpD/RAD55 family RecA-like ATPase
MSEFRVKPAFEKSVKSNLARANKSDKSILEELGGLEHFLNLESHSLLIKGLPGTGKTTLALQLLDYFGSEKGLYFSTRVGQSKLSKQFPWIHDVLSRQNQFSDVRMSDSDSFVQDVIAALTKKSNRVPVIVLDTWDSFAKELEEKDRIKTEKTLVAIADNSHTRVVFVSEEPTRTTIDYLVDGVIELSRREESERIFREVEVLKLRGTPIFQHKYLYTLLDGKFTLLGPYVIPDYSVVKPLKPIPDIDERYSFGSSSVDEVFGGLLKGGTFTIEYGERVPYSAVRMFELPLIVNFLIMGRSVFMAPLPGAGSEDLFSLISRAIPKSKSEGVKERFKIVTSDQSLLNSGKVETFSTTKAQKDEGSKAIDELRSKSIDGKVLLIESISLFENKYASVLNSVVEGLSDRASITQENGDASIFLLQTDSPIRTRVLAMSYNFASLRVTDRSVIFMGEKQNTGAYVVQNSKDNQLLPELYQIV